MDDIFDRLVWLGTRGAAVSAGRLSPQGRFGALSEDHPLVGKPCAVCEAPMEVGQIPSLVTVGPADREEAERMREGRAYNAEAVVAHESCVYPPEVFSKEQASRIVREAFAVGQRAGVQLQRDGHVRGYDVDRLVERLVGEA